MASSRIFVDGWRLTDGVLDAFLLSQPKCVLDALFEAGHIPDVAVGLNSRAAEWVSARSWRYDASFDAPEEDERCVLHFEHLAGCGEVAVNGKPVARFEGGELFVDITGQLRPGANDLSVAFYPPRPTLPIPPDGLHAPLPILGIPSAVRLITTNFVALQDLAIDAHMNGARGQLTARVTLTAYTAGKYVFKYLLSGEEGAIDSFEFTERMPAATREVAHELDFANISAWMPDNRAEYELRLAIERTGVGCETVRARVAFSGGARPTRCVALAQSLPSRDAEAVYDRLRSLGADGVACADAPHRRLRVSGWADGFLSPADSPENTHISRCAMPAERKLYELAGDEPLWPPQCALWRQRGSAPPDLTEYEARFGPGIASDIARFARLSRMLQAEQVRAEAQRARFAGRPALVCSATEAFAQLCSPALIEFDGQARPAFWALAGAWRPVHGCALLPEGGAARAGTLVRLPVWIMADSGARGMYTVTAAAYRLDGSLIADSVYPVKADGSRQLGELALNLPNCDEPLVIRVQVALPDGQLADRCDALLSAYSGEWPLRALLNPPRASLKLEDGSLVNVGDVAALAVTADGFGYGALLPGEKRPMPKIDFENVEWLNPMK